ncbi:hypothetical protein [Staphylococcus aureus]|uniref:hypothetical protein n=1 Tax=Staphylococcus aureus TaxID=1280 RepID=UPI00190F9002|nr:hypothetical protein [Staphylococcus aureus]
MKLLHVDSSILGPASVSRQLSRLKAQGILAFAKGDRDCTVLREDRLHTILNPV